MEVLLQSDNLFCSPAYKVGAMGHLHGVGFRVRISSLDLVLKINVFSENLLFVRLF